MTTPEQAVQAMPERIFLGCADTDNEHQVWTDEGEGGTEYVRADFAAPHLAAVRVNGDRIEAARKAVEELAHVQMNLPLEDWSRISSAILSALEPSAGRAAVLEEAAKIAERHEGEPCRPAVAWTDEQRQFYASGQQDASSSIAAAIRALASHPVADKPDEAGAQGEVKLERSIERWRNMNPAEVMRGTQAQIMYALEDARKDILALAATLPTPPSGEVA